MGKVFFDSKLYFLLIFLWIGSNSSLWAEKNSLLIEINQELNKKVKIELTQDTLVAPILSSNSLVFSRLNDKYSFPVFVFKNKELVYWWGNEPIPEEVNLLLEKKEIKCLKNSTGKILLFKNPIKLGKQSFVFVHVFKLSTKYDNKNPLLSQGVNASLLGNKVASVSFSKAENNVFWDDQFLFSVEFKSSDSKFILYTLLSVLLFTVLALGVFYFIKYLIHKKGVLVSWMVLLAISGVLYGTFSISIKYFPDFLILQYIDAEWFNYFILSILIPVVIYPVFKYGFGNRFWQKNTFLQLIADVFMWSLGYFFAALYFLAIEHWFKNPYYSFNIFTITENTLEKLTTLWFVVSISGCFFMISHILFRYVQKRYARKEINVWLSGVCIGSLFLAVFYLWQDAFLASTTIVILLHAFVVVIFKWPSTLSRPRYLSYLYVFFTIIICCFLSSLAVYRAGKEILSEKAAHWSQKIDREAESIDYDALKAAGDSIATDGLIAESLVGSFIDLDLAEQKIYKYHIGNKFEEYECNVYLFDSEGSCINRSIKGSYFYYLSTYSKNKYRTRYKGIFRVWGRVPNFYSFIPITSNENKVGYVVLELKRRLIVPNSIASGLFKIENYSDNRLIHTKPEYAVYRGGVLVSESGSFAHEKAFDRAQKSDYKAYKTGKFIFGYFQQLFDFDSGKSILVSIKTSWLKLVYSNFSMLFVLLSMVLAVFILINTFYYKLKQVSTTFTTKIQLFLNASFFLPLVVVSIATFGILSNTYKTELEDRYIQKADFTARNISSVYFRFLSKKTDLQSLTDELEKASGYVQSDIVLYDARGKMIANSQPMLFEQKLLPSQINPISYERLAEHSEPIVTIDESIVKFRYKNVYIPIKSLDTGELMGIVSIPFFESDFAYSEKIMDSITLILNIFTFIFILFLIVAYFFSSRLTKPLSLLTEKIKYTSLERNNEPLPYTANDEIGLLVKEYNQMLYKLESNKKALAATEKESAWREMAKQVAHEIKNPLTPMKLALQNMQRLLKSERDDKEQIALKTADVLLEQVDNLNDIATSFSAFAQMPVPVKEKFDLKALTQRIVTLFQNEESAFHISFFHSGDNFNIHGDEKLMGRIIINIIRNAIESVERDENVSITVRLVSDYQTVTLSIADNGSGIADEWKEKVFLPNFSTKSSGSGIGLAVAKRGVEQMGGKIWFETVLNQGTTFNIQFQTNEA